MSEADSSFFLCLSSSVKGEVGILSNDHLDEVSSLALEVLNIILIFVAVFLDFSDDSAKVAFNEAHECLLVSILNLFKAQSLYNITLS